MTKAKGKRLIASELRENWEHSLVGEANVYTIQAGADLVRIARRQTEANNVRTELMVPAEELRGVLQEYDARKAATEQ